MVKKLAHVLDYLVFGFATLAIAGVFYEGMELQWFNIVGVLILLMDYSFMLATVVNCILERKTKWLWVHSFSVAIIVVAFTMKFTHCDFPSITLVLWYFYIWFLYGARITIFRNR